MVVKKLKVYAAILLIPLLGGTAARLLRVVIAFMLRDSGLSVFEITLIFSSFMLSRALFSPIIGHIADKGAKRYIIVIIGFTGLLIDAVLYLHVSVLGIFILRIMDGIYGAMVWPTMQAFVHFSSPKGLKARIMNLYFVMGALGMSVGYLIYTSLFGNVIYAVYLLVVMYSVEIATSFVFKNTVCEENSEKKQSAAHRIDMSLYVLTFFFGMYMSLGNEVLLFYLAEVIGLGKIDSTLILFLTGILALGGSILVSHVADKKGFSSSLILLGILAPLASVLISIDYIYAVLVGVFLFFIAGRAFMPVSRSFTASQSKKIGTSLGFINLSSNMGSVVGPLIGGVMMDTFYTQQIGIFTLVGMTFVIISLMISILTIIFIMRTRMG